MHVPRALKERHIANMRTRGFPDYRIRPDGERDAYAPIALIEPLTDDNRNALGFDISTTPQAHAALLASRDSGHVALSRKLQLVQDDGKPNAPAAVVMYLPIYANGARLDTPEDRRKALLAWVDAPFRMADLIAGLNIELGTDIGLTISENNVESPETLLFRSGHQGGDDSITQLKTRRVLDVGGHRWHIDVVTLPGFERRFDNVAHGRVAFVGVLLSLLFGWITWMLMTSKARAIALAREKTRELRGIRDDLESTLNAIPDLMVELGLDGRIHHYRSSRAELLSAHPTSFLGRKLSDMLPADAANIWMEAVREADAQGISVGKQYQAPHPDGDKWFELCIAKKESGPDDPVRFIAIARDITERKHAEIDLKARDETLRLLEACLSRLNDVVIVTEAEPIGEPGPRIVYVNDAFTRRTGYSREEALGRSPRFLQGPNTARDTCERISAALKKWQPIREELINYTKSGEEYWLEIDIVPVANDSGWYTHWVAVERDITERKQHEEHTYRLAYLDALTGLPNRLMLHDRMKQALASARRTGQMGALIFLDLDNFKQINDARGHAIGDQLLIRIASHLNHIMRTDDTIARLGGDEFVMLVNDLGPDEETSALNVMMIARKVHEALETPYDIDGRRYACTGSIGITIFPKANEDIDDLLREADTAMYRAKAAGRNRISFFQATMQGEVEARLAMEQDLKQALAAGQMSLHVQSQFDSNFTEIGGELLMRWNHPSRGSISPLEFISIAEESGLIIPLGDWVVRQACSMLVQMNAIGRKTTLSVNVSPHQFHQDDFVNRISTILNETGAPADRLVFEVTEGLFIQNWEETRQRMIELVNMGIRFSIDDFGTGYSSLAYLKKLPLYELKIDKSFVQDTPDDPSDTAIVRSILSMAKHLNLRVVAEGVETRAQADFLIANQCDCLQGYLLSRPQPLAAWMA
ncbi:MAG: EAL domain-containing protein [Hydrogenophaga sp.]|nr:EAL domain-containing protein [Hydrogenophaga sp.]